MRRTIVTLMVVAMSAISVAAENAALPDSPVGQRFGDFVEAIRSGDSAQHMAFISQQWKPAPDSSALTGRLEFFNIVHGDLGDFEIYSVDAESDLAIRAVLHAPNSTEGIEWAELGMQLQADPPHLVDRVSLRPADDPNLVLPEPPVTPEKLTSFLGPYIDSLAREDLFSGSIAIAKDGKTFFTKVVGDACKRYDVPNQLDTKFNLGSMNKMFTGVAIMQLAQKGKLKLDDTVGKYLPDYPNEEVKSKVTIRQLLSHRSGMGSYWQELFDTSFWEIRSVKDFAMLTAKKPLDFEPGSQFQYSNSGPYVLAWILEEITGMTYDEYIRQNVTGPAGMTNTDCYPVDEPVKNLAIGYERKAPDEPGPTRWRNNLFMHSAIGGPAGGGYSTAPDLIAFAEALRNATILPKNWIDSLWTVRSPEANYGFLFGVEEVDGHTIVGHSGGAPGINAQLDIFLNDGYDVSVMSNYSGAASQLARLIDRILMQ